MAGKSHTRTWQKQGRNSKPTGTHIGVWTVREVTCCAPGMCRRMQAMHTTTENQHNSLADPLCSEGDPVQAASAALCKSSHLFCPARCVLTCMHAPAAFALCSAHMGAPPIHREHHIQMQERGPCSVAKCQRPHVSSSVMQKQPNQEKQTCIASAVDPLCPTVGSLPHPTSCCGDQVTPPSNHAHSTFCILTHRSVAGSGCFLTMHAQSALQRFDAVRQVV